MGVTKNFTQSAYNDIQAYIGGTEQWDDIRSIYGAVSYSGIYDYDYDACLDQYMRDYAEENEKVEKSLKLLFDDVNGVDDSYASLFKDEQMDMDGFNTAITQLSGILNKNSAENIYTMDVGTFRDKLESVKVSIQSKLIEYYANTYYTENQDGTITFKWDNINYAMRKESDKISNEELVALVMLFPNLYSSDEEQNMENIENMIRAGYGTVDNSEWDKDCKFNDPEIMDMQWSMTYHSVGVTDTFKTVVKLYNEAVDEIDYLDILKISENDFDAYLKYQNQFSMASLFETIVTNYSTIGIKYDGKNGNFTIHQEKYGNPNVSVYLKDLPFDISYANSNGNKYAGYEYNGIVKNGEIGKSIAQKKKESLFHVYSMIDYDKVQDSIIDSLVSDSSKWLEDEKKEVYSNERVVGNTISKELVTNVFDYVMEKSCGYVISDIPGIGSINDVMSGIKDNNDNIENNQKIDDEILKIQESGEKAKEILRFINKFNMNIQLVCVDGKYKMERYYINCEHLQIILDNYNSYCAGNNENWCNLQINDVIDYIGGNSAKKEQIEKFLNENINLYDRRGE